MYKYICTNDRGVRFSFRCDSAEDARVLLEGTITKYSYSHDRWIIERDW